MGFSFKKGIPKKVLFRLIVVIYSEMILTGCSGRRPYSVDKEELFCRPIPLQRYVLDCSEHSLSFRKLKRRNTPINVLWIKKGTHIL